MAENIDVKRVIGRFTERIALLNQENIILLAQLDQLREENDQLKKEIDELRKALEK